MSQIWGGVLLDVDYVHFLESCGITDAQFTTTTLVEKVQLRQLYQQSQVLRSDGQMGNVNGQMGNGTSGVPTPSTNHHHQPQPVQDRNKPLRNRPRILSSTENTRVENVNQLSSLPAASMVNGLPTSIGNGTPSAQTGHHAIANVGYDVDKVLEVVNSSELAFMKVLDQLGREEIYSAIDPLTFANMFSECYMKWIQNKGKIAVHKKNQSMGSPSTGSPTTIVPSTGNSGPSFNGGKNNFGNAAEYCGFNNINGDYSGYSMNSINNDTYGAWPTMNSSNISAYINPNINNDYTSAYTGGGDMHIGASSSDSNSKPAAFQLHSKLPYEEKSFTANMNSDTNMNTTTPSNMKVNTNMNSKNALDTNTLDSKNALNTNTLDSEVNGHRAVPRTTAFPSTGAQKLGADATKPRCGKRKAEDIEWEDEWEDDIVIGSVIRISSIVYCNNGDGSGCNDQNATTAMPSACCSDNSNDNSNEDNGKDSKCRVTKRITTNHNHIDAKNSITLNGVVCSEDEWLVARPGEQVYISYCEWDHYSAASWLYGHSLESRHKGWLIKEGSNYLVKRFTSPVSKVVLADKDIRESEMEGVVVPESGEVLHAPPGVVGCSGMAAKIAGIPGVPPEMYASHLGNINAKNGNNVENTKHGKSESGTHKKNGNHPSSISYDSVKRGSRDARRMEEGEL